MNKKATSRGKTLCFILALVMIASLIPIRVQSANADMSYTVRADSSITGGTITATPAEDLSEGDAVTLTVTPNTGFELKELSVNVPEDIDDLSDLVGLMGSAIFDDDVNATCGIVGDTFAAYTYDPEQIAQLDSAATLTKVSDDRFEATSNGFKWTFYCYGEEISQIDLENTTNSEESYSFYGTSTGSLPAGAAVATSTVEEGKQFSFTMPASDVRVRATFELVNPVALTLHFSSLDGEDLVDPIVIEGIAPGTKIGNAVEEKLGKDWWSDLFTKDGYEDSWYRAPEPLTHYKNLDELLDADIRQSTEINEDMVAYVCMYKAIDTTEISVTPPICGVETTVPKYTDKDTGDEYWEWVKQTNRPVFSVPSGANYHALPVEPDDPYDSPSQWVDMEDYEEPFIGTFEGGTTYKALYSLEADFGYFFPGEDAFDGTIKVNGGDLVENFPVDRRLDMLVTLDADHNWGAWKVTKEPTAEAEGEETRTCSHCGETETRAIPKLNPKENDTRGDGAISNNAAKGASASTNVSTGSAQKSAGTAIAKTGDDSAAGFWLLMMILAAVCAFVSTKCRNA